MSTMTMIEAIRDGHAVAMERDDRVVVFGEDVGYFGGVFRCTLGLQERFGNHRCFDSPINESGIVGAAIGMAAYGLRPCVEIQFADYMYPAYDQIVSEAARLRYRSAADFTAPARRAHADRWGHLWRTDPQPEPRGAVHPRERAQDRRGLEPVRRQGSLDLGHRRRRPGDLPRTETALQRAVRRTSRPSDRAMVTTPARGGARRLLLASARSRPRPP